MGKKFHYGMALFFGALCLGGSIDVQIPFVKGGLLVLGTYLVARAVVIEYDIGK